jgi:hypothetical protein
MIGYSGPGEILYLQPQSPEQEVIHACFPQGYRGTIRFARTPALHAVARRDRTRHHARSVAGDVRGSVHLVEENGFDRVING